MKQLITLLFLCASIGLFAQINYSANDQVTPYTGLFRPGVNPSFYPNWSSEQVADVAAGNPLFGVPGVGVKTLRTAMSDAFVTEFGYDYLLPTYDYYGDLGLTDLTVIVGFPDPSHQENTEYCPGIPSEMFAGLYEPIWDGGANGTPYDDNNLFAAYMYEIVTRYTPYVKFWEIWNEPGFDYTGNCGWREPGDPVCNWWDQNPNPCDYKLRAPIESYVRTLRIAYDIIKTVSPDDYVVVAGVGFESFLDAILRNTDHPNGGGNVTADYPLHGGAYFDVMGFHSYPHFDGSTIYYDNNVGGLVFERHSDRAAFGIPFKQTVRQAVMDNYGYDGVTYPKKEWIITEINIPRDPVGGPYIGSEEAQKNYIIKAMVNAMKFGVNQIHVFRLGEREYFSTANNGQTGNPEFNLMGLYQRMDDILPYEQIINIEGIAYKTASDCLFGSTFDEAKTAEMNLPSNLDGGAFLQPDGSYTYVIWAKTTVDLSESAIGAYAFPPSFGFTDIYQKEWNFSQTFASTLVNANNIALTATPIFLTEEEFELPAMITLFCPDDITVFADQNANGAVVNFNPPDVSTTCSSGLVLTQTGGFGSGEIFPVGTTEVEFEASDDCGNIVICQFKVLVQSPIGGCPDAISGFNFLGTFNGHKYFLSENVAKPADAQIQAQTVGGHLAVVNDQTENDFIQQGISELVYLGINDASTEGQLEWVNTQPVTFTNFDICSFCNGNSEQDDYVVMHSWNGGWSYSNEFNQRLFVIELPCDSGGGTNLSITCPPDQSLTTASVGETINVSWNPPTTSGNCITGITNIQQTGGPTSGDALSAGVYTVSYSAMDGCGNTSNCSFTITVTDGGGGGPCPEEISGFTIIGEFNGHKYYLSNEASRPVDAQATAEANNGYLAVINDQSENDFIQQNISEMTYIGLNDFDTEGNLVWVNGDPLNYNNIDPCGFCEVNSEEQDFVIIAPWNGTWSFSNFYNQRPYVMEVDCDGGGGNGEIIITCPPDMQFTTDPNTGVAYVDFSPAVATTSCPQGGLVQAQTGGIPPGFEYGPGNYPVTFIAIDDCGNMKTCTFYVEVIEGGGGGCPDNLPNHTLLGEFGGSAYFLSNDVARPEDAEAMAQGLGGHLATIGSQAENDFLFSQVSGLVYIGLNDVNTEGTLAWYSGESVNYTNFDICSFCNNNSPDMNYVAMHGWNGGWSWSNFWNQRPYVVEIPCASNLSTENSSTLIPASPDKLMTDLPKKPKLESVIPNPAEHFIFVKIKSETEESVDLQIFDARGVLVHTSLVNLHKGLNFQELDISDLPSGLFFIKIPQGQQKHSDLKFIKQRL